MKSLGYEMLKSCYCTTLLCAVLCRATTYHWLTCQWNNQCLEFHSRWLWIYSSHSLYMKDEDHVSAGNSLWWFCHGLTCYTSERRITTLCHASRMSLSLVIVIVVIVIIWYLISVMCCCVENALLNNTELSPTPLKCMLSPQKCIWSHVTLTFDLWPFVPLHHCLLTWWIFVPRFS